MNLNQLVNNHVNHTKAIVTDGDKTAWKGQVAEGIGKSYIINELLRLHLPTVRRALKGAGKVKQLARSDPISGPTRGLIEFYKVLTANGVGTRDGMHKYALSYISKNEIAQVAELLRYDHELPKFLSTAGGSTGALAAAEHFGFVEWVANKDIFDADGKLVMIEVRISDPYQKELATADMLRKYGIKLKDCTVIGDSEMDMGILNAAKLSIASPFAVDAVRRITMIQL
jgi:hypothetical protein